MITIYNAPGSRSLRVVWMCEEMGLPYETRTDSILRPSAEFRRIHPGVTFPVMIDGDLVLTESIAIIQYLGDRYGPTPLVKQPGEPGYALYLEYLVFGEASLAAFMTPLVATKFRAPAAQKDNFTVGMLKQMAAQRFESIERRLAASPYMAGESFTAADISVGYACSFAIGMEVCPLGERTAAYWAKLQERPAFQRAYAVGRQPAA
jgi:glutathione S-transferase